MTRPKTGAWALGVLCQLGLTCMLGEYARAGELRLSDGKTLEVSLSTVLVLCSGDNLTMYAVLDATSVESITRTEAPGKCGPKGSQGFTLKHAPARLAMVGTFSRKEKLHDASVARAIGLYQSGTPGRRLSQDEEGRGAPEQVDEKGVLSESAVFTLVRPMEARSSGEALVVSAKQLVSFKK